MKFRVTTESGSVYRLDTKAKVMIREPGEHAGVVHQDGEPIRYTSMWKNPKVGEPMLFFWLRGDEEDTDWPMLRQTTYVTRVEELDDSA